MNKLHVRYPCLILLFHHLLTGSLVFTQVVSTKDAEIGFSGDMRSTIERFTQDRSDLEWAYRIPMSRKRINRLRNFYMEWRTFIEDIDFESLNSDGRIDYILFRNMLDHEKCNIDHREKIQKEIHHLIPFWEPIVELKEKQQFMVRIDSKEVASLLDSLSHQIESVQTRMTEDLKSDKKSDLVHLNKNLVQRAVTMTIRLREALKEWFRFYNGYDPEFTWWVDLPYKKLDRALDTHISVLRENILGIRENGSDSPIIGDPIGRKRLLDELAYAMIPYTPEELIEIGRREYAWCEEEMVRTARELGYGDNWRKALEYVKTLHAKPGEQPYLIWDQAWEAVEFLTKHDLITVPPLALEVWKIGMMSPERQKINPFFTGGRVISVSFPTHTMSHENKLMSMRGNNMHFSRATVHHELIPGHHLQFFMMARYKTYRKIFQTPFWLEGWPLHWEMLLWDLEFPQSLENRMGMLFWRMHRCARIIFSLRFHLEKMTPQACVEMLIHQVGHEPANAVAEVRRSCGSDYPPLYQCAYMIGGLQMRALYHELVSSGHTSNREFHDAVMKENSMPIELLRVKLKDLLIDKQYQPEWRFYDL